ncbi:MAG: thiamine diphosphokinase [Bacteroides sp.]|nr:thiamine diphosphokinase [Bacteroides sp.]
MKHILLPTADSQPQAVILANGDYPSHPLPLTLLEQAPYVICCDGAANEYIRRRGIPAAIIGDGDSLLPEFRQEYASLFQHIGEQESNDLTKAFRYCLQAGKKEILILGATGKREDHTLGNISLLMEYMQEAQVQMVTDYGVFTPLCDDSQVETLPGQQISLFNFGATHLRAEGLAYPISDFTSWWQGTLNEAQKDRITIYGKGKYLIFRHFF